MIKTVWGCSGIRLGATGFTIRHYEIPGLFKSWSNHLKNFKNWSSN